MMIKSEPKENRAYSNKVTNVPFSHPWHAGCSKGSFHSPASSVPSARRDK
jgi:hypothetical protein